MNRGGATLVLGVLLFVWTPGRLVARSLRIPAGTVVYGELDQAVTARRHETAVGDQVRARVWRHVVVNGGIAIAAGTQMELTVSARKTAGMAHGKGNLELRASSVSAVDGSRVTLDGGYDRATKGHRTGKILLSAAFWPLLFTKGKQLELAPGVIFDSVVQADAEVETETASAPEVDASPAAELVVEVVYNVSGKRRDSVPLVVTRYAEQLPFARVITVNDRPTEPIPVRLGQRRPVAGCLESRGSVSVKALRKHFNHGINRFEVEAGEVTAEVLLNVEY